MLEETGTVVAVRNEQLIVETISRSSCSRCSSSGCSTSVISKLFGFKRNQLVMQNTLGARQGNRVVVGIPDAVLVKASVWAYLLPIASMVLVTWIMLLTGASDGLQALSALFGMVAGLIMVNRLTASRQRSQQFEPVLLRIQGQVNENMGLTEFNKF